MKKLSLFFMILFCSSQIHAANLIDVYRQALASDPTYQQAVAQRKITRAGLPISFASILPNLDFYFSPALTRTGLSGTMLAGTNSFPFLPRNNTELTYTMRITLTQSVFDFAKLYRIAGEVSNSKAADATLNAALQNLMVRVADAYFAILRDEENVLYANASKVAFASQLDQVNQQFKVGLKTLTDVYTARASFDSALATYIAAQTSLTKSRENLRVLTGVYYTELDTLSARFPLLTPMPADIEAWVKMAYCHNWNIKASQYLTEAAKQNVKQQMSGHFPTVDVQVMADRLYDRNINGYMAVIDRNGPGIQSDRQVSLNLRFPILSGGAVYSRTQQATSQYELAQQQLEQTIRDTINNARKSYLEIMAGISQIKADQQAIKSSISSTAGLKASYQVGTETLVDVLNQQQKVYQAQTSYATDRYKFITNIFRLKQAAGTLSFDDLHAINAWLTKDKPKKIICYKRKVKVATH